MFNKTVVPLDDRDESASILPAAAALVNATNGELMLITVLGEDEFESDHVKTGAQENPTPEHGEMLGPVVGASAPVSSHSGRTSSDISKKESVGGDRPNVTAVTEAIERLETHAGNLREQGLQVSVKVTYGEPANEILRVVRDEQADSLAVATHHKSAIARTLSGSVTDELIQESPVPVLGMHVSDEASESNGNATISTIIVPADGDPTGEMAVEPAISLASKLGAKIVFVQSVNSPAVTSTVGAAPELMATLPGQGMKEITAQAEEYLASLVAKAESAGVKAVAQSHFGSASSVIISTAKSHENSLVVMASNARSGIARTILGSNADEVVRNLTSPVLVLKERDEANDS